MEKMLVVYNPYSRNKNKNKLDKIKNELSKKFELTVYKTEGPKSITNYISESNGIFDVVLVLGGDGTVNEAVNGIMKLERKPRLAIMPFGTCNDIAKSLGLKSVNKALKYIMEDSYRLQNVFKINDSYFVYGLATGGVSSISYRVNRTQKKYLGKNAYYLNTIKAVFEKNPKIDLVIDDGRLHIEDTFYLLLALNTRYLAGVKIRKSKEKYNDSKLHVVLFKKQHRLQGFINFALYLVFGRVSKNMVVFDATKLTIKCEEGTVFNTDGEPSHNAKKINIMAVNDELHVYAKSNKQEEE